MNIVNSRFTKYKNMIMNLSMLNVGCNIFYMLTKYLIKKICQRKYRQEMKRLRISLIIHRAY